MVWQTVCDCFSHLQLRILNSRDLRAVSATEAHGGMITAMLAVNDLVISRGSSIDLLPVVIHMFTFCL